MSEEKELSFDEAFDLYTEGDNPEAVKASEDTSTETNADQTDTEKTEETVVNPDTVDEQKDGQEQSPETIEEAIAQAKLWEQRFKSYEGRVQAEMERRREEELMRQQQFIQAMNPTKKEPEVQQDEVPSKFKHLAEEFPEIAEAVQELLDKRFQDATGMVKRAIDERITPIAADMSRQKISSHLERILIKHPDAVALRQGGKLDAWINTMPTYAQHGARYIINSGNADEVVALLDQYKDSSKNTTHQNTDKPASTDQGNREPFPGMVEAVKAGLAVKSGRSPDPKTDQKVNSKDNFDAGWEQALKDLGMN